MSVSEAGVADTPFGRYITSAGWFVLNLGDALAVRNQEKGGVAYPIESQEHQFENFGVHLRVLWPGDPNALYHAEGVQEGFLVACWSSKKKSAGCGNGTISIARPRRVTSWSAPATVRARS